MIKFTVKKSGSGKISEIKVIGHSGYDKRGRDIVCAAVSTACQMAVAGIENQALARTETQLRDGFLSCKISEEREEGADFLLNSLMMTIYQIAEQYKKYLFIVEV